jgi:hypothetical protein
MGNAIMEFLKTDRFLLRQWERNIENGLVHKILPYVETDKRCNQKGIVIITPSFLSPKGIQTKTPKQCLVLIHRNRRLLSVYWCDHPAYLLQKEKDAKFQFLY